MSKKTSNPPPAPPQTGQPAAVSLLAWFKVAERRPTPTRPFVLLKPAGGVVQHAVYRYLAFPGKPAWRCALAGYDDPEFDMRVNPDDEWAFPDERAFTQESAAQPPNEEARLWSHGGLVGPGHAARPGRHG